MPRTRRLTQIRMMPRTRSLMPTSIPTRPNIADAARARILREAAKGGYMGFDVTEAFYPHGVTKGYGWGSQPRRTLCRCLRLRLPDHRRPANFKSTYFGILSQFGDYALGLNPSASPHVTGLEPSSRTARFIWTPTLRRGSD